MALFTMDDRIANYSTIVIPADTRVRCVVDRTGDTVEVSFGDHGRITLELHAGTVDALIHALVDARGERRIAAAKAHADAEGALDAYLTKHPMPAPAR